MKKILTNKKRTVLVKYQIIIHTFYCITFYKKNHPLIAHQGGFFYIINCFCKIFFIKFLKWFFKEKNTFFTVFNTKHIFLFYDKSLSNKPAFLFQSIFKYTYLVCFFPRQINVCSAKMSICGCLLINGTA